MKKLLAMLMALILLWGVTLPVLAESWNCSCGKTNDSNFCPGCGAAKPKEQVCSSCGYKPETSFKFCPQCGTPFGQTQTPAPTAAPTERTFAVTSVIYNGDGTTEINWEDSANGGPYTIWCAWGSSGIPQMGATDVYGTTCTVNVIEPGMSYAVWVEDGAGQTDKYLYQVGKIADAYPVQIIATSDIFRYGEEVEAFSVADIEYYKANNGDVAEWEYPYTMDITIRYDFPTDRRVRFQAFLLTDNYADILVAYDEELFIPAGERYVLKDVIRLSRFFESETVLPGIYTISLYFDGLRASMGSFKVTE